MRRTLILALSVAICPSVANAQSFVSIFTSLPSDFSRLVAPSNLLILGGAGGVSLGLLSEDDAFARRVNDGDQFFAPGTVIGDAPIHAAAGLAVFVAGRVSHNTRLGELGTELLRAQLVSGLITDGLKLATNRTRPDGQGYSFPSGHTSSAFATAAVLQGHLGWKVGIPAYAIASYVASSRMANYRHYVSDVVFGVGIGVAAGRATTFHHRGAQITLIPGVSQDSASINVSVIK